MSRGKHRPSVKARLSLASQLRDAFPAALHVQFYKLVFMGKVPELVDLSATDADTLRTIEYRKLDVEHYCEVHPADDTPCPDCGWPLRFVPGPGGLTPDHKMLNQARLLERQYGQAAQHHVVEGEIRAEVTAISAINRDMLSGLEPHILKLIMDAFAGVKPKDPEELPAGPEVEDAEVVEVES